MHGRFGRRAAERARLGSRGWRTANAGSHYRHESECRLDIAGRDHVRPFDAVQHLYDSDKARWRFVLCGSSARELRMTGANLLPGRCFLHRLYPLVLAEQPAPTPPPPHVQSVLPLPWPNRGDPVSMPEDMFVGFHAPAFSGSPRRSILPTSRDGAEIDFVIEREGRLTPIDVKWTERPGPTDARHLRRFIQEHADRVTTCYIVCRCPTPQLIEDKVMALPWQCL